jgi:hypothetical protein
MEPRLSRRLSILLLGDDHPGHANTVLDHIGAFRRWSRHDVRTFNPVGLRDARSLDLDEFDVVVIHYSIYVISEHYLSEGFREKLRGFRGLKAQFIQDEYRWIDRISLAMRDLGVNALFTCVPPASLPKIWSEARLPGVRKIPTLTGYVPDALVGRRTRATRDRAIEIGYRGRDVPWWLGALGQEKIEIGRGVLERADKYRLRCDIAWTEDRRIYGRQWVQFTSSCRTVLGTESGASIADFDGSIENGVREYLTAHRGASFEEVHRAVLAGHEGNAPVVAISPRMFEAAALDTGLVLFPGEYSGILEAGTHYIPLNKDFSNLEDVVAKVRDVPSLVAMIERARRDLVSSGHYSYRAFIRQFDLVVDEMASPRARAGKSAYRKARLEGALRRAGQRAGGFLSLLPVAYVRAGLGLLVALRTPEVRRLMMAYLRRPEVRRRTPLLPVVLDLLRLGLLAQAATGSKALPFHVAGRLDPVGGRLTFVSTPRVARLESAPSDPAALQQLRAMVAGCGLKVLEWDHSAIGPRVSYRRRPLAFSIPIGVGGRHRFTATEDVLRDLPDETGALLEAIGAAALRGTGAPADYFVART